MLLGSTVRPTCARCALRQQIRHATLIRRPRRPYTFTQLVTLSDGSTFLHRTTSPQAVYRSTKDTKNTAMWNPSSQRLLNVEEDEAGRLKRFRRRFGRGFDAESAAAQGTAGENPTESQKEEDESLFDMLSSYGQDEVKAKAAKKQNAQDKKESK